jgi:hypothetical protein
MSCLLIHGATIVEEEGDEHFATGPRLNAVVVSELHNRGLSRSSCY